MRSGAQVDGEDPVDKGKKRRGLLAHRDGAERENCI